MRGKRLFIGLRATLATLAVVLLVTSTSVASEKKLHNFGMYGAAGKSPQAGLVSDAVGNLYGTNKFGGDYGAGTVFELSPNASGGWTEKKLHNFGIHGTDGAYPTTSLVLDASGNLYGATAWGGDYGSGMVFELSPNGSGGWTEKKLHNFGITRTDGSGPSGGLVFDASGNLYGTTSQGGNYGGCHDGSCGTVFELSPNGNGGWTEKKLHNFSGGDGAQPQGPLVFDAAGNLYGTTTWGGSHGGGTAFELSPNGNGGWTEKKLHNFGSGTDGVWPSAPLIFDAAGNVYGTTANGGNNGWCWNGYPDAGCGTVFELSPREDGGWTEKKLHSFGYGRTDGTTPNPGLVFDTAGNLYGTTNTGGDTLYSGCGGFGCGTLFELSPREDGGWTERKVHNFGTGADGALPNGVLIFDAAGNLYGMTSDGGSWPGFGGTVFEITQ